MTIPKDARALLLSCMDLRLLDEIVREMDRRGLTDRYDHVIFAGASLGALTRKYPHWGRAFFDHIGLARKLHGVTHVILLDHRDCGAYDAFLGLSLAKDRDQETEVHRKHQALLRKRIRAVHPDLEVHGWLMDLNGRIEDLGGPPARPQAVQQVTRRRVGRRRTRKSAK